MVKLEKIKTNPMKLRIAQITDLHLDEEFPRKNGVLTRKRFDKVLEDLSKKDIDEVICTGDIGENDGIHYFFNQLKPYKLTITLGNHDSYSEISKYYSKGARSSFEKFYMSSERKYHKLLFLDSSAEYVDVAQLNWLEQELISSKPLVIFMHHPVIGLGLKLDEIAALQNRDQVFSIMNRSPSEINLFSGHYHLESNKSKGNITQYITPAVCFQMEKDPDQVEINSQVFGYRIIELGEGYINSEVRLFSDAD